jgi:hypothetical protein
MPRTSPKIPKNTCSEVSRVHLTEIMSATGIIYAILIMIILFEVLSWDTDEISM